MALPRYDEIHLPLLKLIQSNSVHSPSEAAEILAKKFGLTEQELAEEVPSGGSKFYSQVSFSKMLLVRAGLIFKGYKPYRVTDKAKKIIAENPSKITKRTLDDLAKKRKSLKIQRDKNLAEISLLKSYDDYLRKFKNRVTPNDFERITGLVLSKVYNLYLKDVEITPPTNDSGIDGIIHLGDGADSKIYFQSKCFNNGSIGAPMVQQFVGALEGVYGTKGYFVTTSGFSPKAIKYVNMLRDKEITLIDGHKLVELIFKHKLENQIFTI